MRTDGSGGSPCATWAIAGFTRLRTIFAVKVGNGVNSYCEYFANVNGMSREVVELSKSQC